MKTCISLFAVAVVTLSSTAHAAQKELTPQQLRMKECSASAKEKGLRKEERRAFMKECLSGKTVAAATQAR